MRYPSFIQQGDTVGFVAPSFGCSIEPYRSAFDHSLQVWEEKGFHTKLGPNCYAAEGIGISNTPEKCAEELMTFFADKETSALISCGGGELMCEVISHIDFSCLADAKPKWYMGYSDNTNLIFLLTTLADTAAIYGPNAGAFGMAPWHESIEDAFQMLQGNKLTVHNYAKWEKESLKDEEHPLEPYHVTEPFVLHKNTSEEEITFEGRLVGGCLDCLNNLVGTRFDKVVTSFADKYKKDGFIWFLEACELNVMDMRRAMWHMKEAGWFQYSKGFLIGRPGIYNQPMFGLDQYEAICGVLDELEVPVLMDLDIGHVAPSLPLISGAMATVCCSNNEVEVRMELR